MSIVDNTVKSVLEILDRCDFTPTDAENLLIDTHMALLNDEQRDEVDMLISARVMVSRAQTTAG